MSNIEITADDVRDLLAADYSAVLVHGQFLDSDTAIMADSTAHEKGYRVLLTRTDVYDAWGDEIGDAEAEQYAAEMTEQVANSSGEN